MYRIGVGGGAASSVEVCTLHQIMLTLTVDSLGDGDILNIWLIGPRRQLQ